MKLSQLSHTLMAAALSMTAATPTLAQSSQRGDNPRWLEQAVFYQIYPSSYMDTDGNGIGDLPGITQKLDYIQSLGVNALWLNPVFESGWFDGGYDVIDFYKIDPRFGTNTDMVTLIDEAHKRGIKVCLDLVAGHTSVRSEWFRQSMQRDAHQRYSDYYIWTDDIPQQEKNNIELRRKDPIPEASTRGRYVEANAPRARYYEKNFFECQPSLNYGFAHPDPSRPWEQGVDAPGPQAVRREIRNIMAFWFDKGIDGFRVDMAASLVKNDPDKKEVSRLWNEMRTWKDRHYPETVLISEWSDPEVAIPAGFNIDFMIHFGLKGYSSLFFNKTSPFAFNTDHEYCYFDKSGKGQIREFVTNFTRAYQATRGMGYIALPSANHDYQRPHAGSRNSIDQLKVTMTFFLTMPGVPFIYYGDEIAMRYQPGLPSKEGSNERAGTRTPMQWAPGPQAGFSTCAPADIYFPVATDDGRLTVEAQEADPASMLHFTRSLVSLRQSVPALGNTGEWALLSSTDQPYPMIYSRSKDGQTYIVALNPGGKAVSARIAPQGGRAVCVSRTGKASYKPGRQADVLRLDSCSAAVFSLR